jgi:hypothetical protein
MTDPPAPAPGCEWRPCASGVPRATGSRGPGSRGPPPAPAVRLLTRHAAHHMESTRDVGTRRYWPVAGTQAGARSSRERVCH